MSDFQKNGVMKRLAQLDDDLLSLYGTSRRFEIVIVGGSALMIRGLTPDERFTTDIDVLQASQELEHLLERYDMNTDVSTFLYKYPANWESRRVRVPFEGEVLGVYTLSNEDLAITKLLSWREVDKQDISNMLAAGTIKLTKIESLLDDILEVRVALEDEEWEQLLTRFESIREDGRS